MFSRFSLIFPKNYFKASYFGSKNVSLHFWEGAGRSSKPTPSILFNLKKYSNCTHTINAR